MLKKYFIATIMLLFSYDCLGETSDQKSMHFLYTFINNKKSIKANFTQTVIVINDPNKQAIRKGTIYLSIPGKLRVEYNDEIIICNHNKMMRYDGQLDTVSYLPLKYNSLGLLLAGKKEVFDSFEIKQIPMSDYQCYKLVNKSKKNIIDCDYLSLYFNQNELIGWDIMQQQILTQVRLDNIANIKINDSIFALTQTNIQNYKKSH